MGGEEEEEEDEEEEEEGRERGGQGVRVMSPGLVEKEKECVWKSKGSVVWFNVSCAECVCVRAGRVCVCVCVCVCVYLLFVQRFARMFENS